MNWRATHLDTGAGIQIIPNATIAGASFANLARPTPEHDLVVEASFAAGDVPHEVMGVLYDVAVDMPYLRPRAAPSVSALGGGKYAVVLPLSTAGDSADARSQFTTWLWYAARRAGLTLDGAAQAPTAPADVRSAVDRSLATLGLPEEDLASLAAQARLAAFAPGESVVLPGEVPEVLRYVVSGVVVEQLPTRDGSVVEAAEHDVGEAISVEAVLREPATTRCVARGVVSLLELPATAVDQIVSGHPEVARRLNALVDLRANQRATAALDARGERAASAAGPSRRRLTQPASHSVAAATSAATPRRSVGSSTGANWGEWFDGRPATTRISCSAVAAPAKACGSAPPSSQ